MIPQPTFESVSQTAHALFGMLCVVVAAYFFSKPGYGATVVFIWSVGKEFWYDTNYEPPDISGGFWGDIRDFIWYNVGSTMGYGVWWLHGLIT
ncbi:MAG TPA: hypothetical protein VEP90_04105 [Methylomirabilota bacterium]|nr:hypothetical protein [Methylomirabilota bacterium]